MYDWLWRASDAAAPVFSIARRPCRKAMPEVARWAEGFDTVVTTYPQACQTVGMLRATGQLAVPAVGYLTDPYAHRMWVHDGMDLHLTVTEATAAQGRARFGIPMQVGGPLASPDFAAPVEAAARAAVRAELGVRTDQVMALVVSGSLGLGDVASTARALSSARDVVPVVLCGRSRRLHRRCSALPGVVALGWRSDMAVLTAAADVLVQNAGGMALTEALAAGLPAVTYAPIAGQGRPNAAVLARSGLVPWPRNPQELVAAVRQQAARGRVDRLDPDGPQHVVAVVAELAYRTWEARTAPSAAPSSPASCASGASGAQGGSNTD
ncbi:glycosyltransferase [Streptomyces sp. NPDC051183]